jgi:hypothetical protein
LKLVRGTEKEHAMSQKSSSAIAVVGIDIGKNSFHIVGHDRRGAIVLLAAPVFWHRNDLIGFVRVGVGDWVDHAP